MNKPKKTYGLAGLILAVGTAASFSIILYSATAQTPTLVGSGVNGPTIQGITFPVSELGNCSSESDCRAYCNSSSHMQACIAFAKNHGLINQKDAQRAQEFAQVLQSGGGPGGCTSPDQCAAYCSDLTHLDTCLSFAKAHGISDDHVAQGKKISAYIQAGGKMPGGCTSQDSCQSYCGDFSHAQECYEFAKAAGIAQTSGQAQISTSGASTGQNPSPDQLRKLSQLAQSGQTPGGCKTKDDCQTYCSDASHLDECLTFGVKAGFMTQEQADMIRKTGGKGPNGCDSPQSCQAYCNNREHQDECFKFAQEHGFISKDDERRIQNGLVQVRSGLEQAPPEVVACIKSSLGPSVVDQIESGQLVPGPDVADQIRSCFEKFGHKEEVNNIFRNLPSGVLSCVKDKLGSDFDKIQSGNEVPTPEMADTIRICFQSMQIERLQGGQGGEFGPSNEGNNHQKGPMGGFQDFLRTAPPEITSCLQQALGSDFDKVKSGEQPTDTGVFQKVQTCFSNFHPVSPANSNLPPPPYQGSPAPSIPSKTACPPASYWNGSSCVGVPSSTGGFALPPPQFTPPSSTPPQQCQTGQYWNGASCVGYSTSTSGLVPPSVFPSTTLPAYSSGSSSPPYLPQSVSSTAPSTSCPSGQYWNGTSCISSMTTTCPSGQYWNGSSCVSSTATTTTSTSDPATVCTKSGGTWTGTSCQTPSSTYH